MKFCSCWIKVKISFTTDNAKMLAQLEGILEATYYSTFPELYVKLSDLN